MRQDGGAAATVGWVHLDAPVEPPGSQQRRVEHVGAVGRRQDDHALVRVEPVHLGEDLVERLLLLVVAADAQRGAARPADRVHLVDEDDRRRGRARLAEEVADAGRAHADDGLDELRRRDGEERHARLARDGARQQRLAGPGCADEQHALGHGAAEALVLGRLLEEVDDLEQLSLHLVDPGDVGEGGGRMLGVVQARAALPEAPEDAARAVAQRRHAAADVHEEEHQEQHRAEAEQQRLPQRRRRVGVERVDGHLVRLQQTEQVVAGERGRCVEKLVAVPWPEPAVTAFLVVPVIASDVLVTLVTLSAFTCCTKTSYGITTDFGCAVAKNTLVKRMLIAKSTTRVIRKLREKNGLRTGGVGGVADHPGRGLLAGVPDEAADPRGPTPGVGPVACGVGHAPSLYGVVRHHRHGLCRCLLLEFIGHITAEPAMPLSQDSPPLAIAFDVDETLVSTGGAGARSWARAFDTLWGATADISKFTKGGMTDPEVARTTFAGVMGREPSPEELTRLMHEYLQFLPQEVAASPGYHVLPGVESLLPRLIHSGILVGITSGAVEAATHIKLARAGLNQYFSFGGFGSDSNDRGELTRTAIRRAALVHGAALDPARVCVVGDTPLDIAAAHAADAVGVGVATGRYTAAAARAGWCGPRPRGSHRAVPGTGSQLAQLTFQRVSGRPAGSCRTSRSAMPSRRSRRRSPGGSRRPSSSRPRPSRPRW